MPAEPANLSSSSSSSSPLLRGCDESAAAAAAVVLKGERQEVSEEEEEEAPQHAELSSSHDISSHDLSSSHDLGTTGTIAALPDVGAAAPATARRADLDSERDDALEERLEYRSLSRMLSRQPGWSGCRGKAAPQPKQPRQLGPECRLLARRAPKLEAMRHTQATQHTLAERHKKKGGDLITFLDGG